VASRAQVQDRAEQGAQALVQFFSGRVGDGARRQGDGDGADERDVVQRAVGLLQGQDVLF